jgi:hypothetical protein
MEAIAAIVPFLGLRDNWFPILESWFILLFGIRWELAKAIRWAE